MQKTKNEELNRISVGDFILAEKTPLVLVLDNVRSLHNVGSAFRTADAFRVESICLCGITGKPPDREIRKTALGATESVAWKYYPTTLEAVADLKTRAYRICSVEQVKEAIQLDSYVPGKGEKLALIFGNEVNGVGQEVIDASDLILEIPQQGTKHSLNVSVSVGVVVWELWKKMKQALDDSSFTG